MREQLQAVEEQVSFYQEQIANRDAEVYQLRQSVQELTDRSRMLEQVVQELPGVYRQKFAERIEPIKEKLDQLQKENRQLHTELQSVTYRLAVRNRRAKGLDLPRWMKRTIAAFKCRALAMSKVLIVAGAKIWRKCKDTDDQSNP